MTYHIVTTYDLLGEITAELEGSITATDRQAHSIADAADAAMDLYHQAVKQNQQYPAAFAVFCFIDSEPVFFTTLQH